MAPSPRKVGPGRRTRIWLRRLDQIFRSPFAGPAIGVLTFAVILAARTLGLLAPLELRVYDQYVRWRAELRPVAAQRSEQITLVEITEADLTRFGHPIPDDVLARVLGNLSALGPRAIGVDLYRDRAEGEGIEALARVAEQNPGIVFIELLARRKQDRIAPPPFLAGRPQSAVSNMVLDPDGVLRRSMIFVYDDDDAAHPSLAWWLAERSLAQEKPPIEPGPGRDDPEGERLSIALGQGEVWRFLEDDGGYRGAYDGDYQMLMDFAGARQFPALELGDAFDGNLDPALVRGRVLILGSVAPSVKDDFISPLPSLRPGSLVTKGIEIHAMAVDQLLRIALSGSTPDRVANELAESAWILLWCLTWGFVGVRVRQPSRVLLAFGLGLGALAMSFPLFVAGWWIPVVPPALAWLLAGGVSAVIGVVLERHARETLDRLLFSHVSEKVAKKLWRESHELAVHGRLPAQQASLTVLMTDLEGFTKSSEMLEPGEVMSWLNEYMDAMVPVVEAHDGLVDGYWGDAIKADFGAPEPRTTEAEIDADARNACRCALAMGAAMRILMADWRERGFPLVRMRIGINTGAVVMGSQGSTARLKYTSMGDTVNTAARLEAFDKDGFAAEPDPFACRILVSASTRDRLGHDFALEDLGEHPLKGKGAPTRIFRLLREEPASPTPSAPAGRSSQAEK